MTSILILLIIKRESSWYRDVMDYIGGKEKPDNDRTPVKSLTNIQSLHSPYQSTFIYRHQRSALVCSPVTSSPPICNPIMSSPRLIKTTPPI